MKKYIFLFIFCFIILFVPKILVPETVLAQNYVSTDYILSDPVFGESGPYVSSPSFKERSALGQTATGISQSTNFILKSGFEYYSGQSVPSITMSLNTNLINFNTVAPNTIVKSPTNSIITISSNAESGYNLYIEQNNNLTNQQGDTIPQVSNGATTTTAAPWTSASYYGLGYNCSSANTYEQAVLVNSPIGFWSLGETTGTTAYDLSGNGNNGTYTGGYTQGAPGPISNSNLGNSTLFNGSNSYVSLPNVIQPYTIITISLWFKTTSDGIILGYQNATVGSAQNDYVPIIYIGTDGKLRAELWNGLVDPITTTNTVNDGRWHNITLVANSTTQSLYFDNSLVGTLSGTITNLTMTYNQLGTGYGSSWPSTNGSWFYFKGGISNVSIYTSALSSSQIQTLFNDGINSTQAFCSPDFINTNYYRQLSSTTNTEFASYSSIATNQTITVGYAVNVSNIQASGIYTNNIIYTLTGNY